MSKKIAESILRGLEQALAYAKGEADVSKYRVHTPNSTRARTTQRKSKTKKPRGRLSSE